MMRRHRNRFVAMMALLPAMLLSAQVLAFLHSSTVVIILPDESFTEREVRQILSHRLPSVPPDSTNRFADDPRAAAFGQRLFFETRFSRNGLVSCATCHVPERAFADGRSLAIGLAELNRHTPSLLNVAYRRWHFWDGRADTLWMQAVEPFEQETEYDSDRTSVVRVIAEDESLRQAYESIFGPLPAVEDRSRFPEAARPVIGNQDDPMHQAWQTMSESDRTLINRAFINLGKAIAAYERRLIVRNAPFDRFAEALAAGDDAAAREAMSGAARRGLKLFLGRANCRACHFGPNFTDEEFHNNGVPPLRGGPPRDAGRFEGLAKLLGHPFNAAGEFSDDRDGEVARRTLQLRRSSETWGQMKTPTLRNVAESAPYMHAGQFASLEEVVRFYSTLEGQVQAGHHRETILQPLNLTEEEIHDLVAFLESLTGTIQDPALLKLPNLPRSDEPTGDGN